MYNAKVDIPKSALHNEGNIWLNKQSGQLRYSLTKDDPSKWVVPLSVYEVGNDATAPDSFIKRGQPVSIGYLDDLSDLVKNSADPSVVPTDPHKYQWCIGLALEPGNATANDEVSIFNHVHILSHGQIEYSLQDDRPNVFQPPIKNGKYVWTYEDIGKPVYVSNHPDDNNGKIGGLSLDITHAYFEGANIVTVGRLADAPALSQTNPATHKIVIEVQLAGDVRGMIDSTQFDVTIAGTFKINENTPNEITVNEQTEITTTHDKLLFVSLLTEPPDHTNVRGVIIQNDELLVAIPSNTPIGCFKAKPVNGKIKIADYIGKTVLVHRLGIIEGNFDFDTMDSGKELFLARGEVTAAGPANTFEYKVGVILTTGRVLIDCRYPRFLKKFEAIGTIKPAYMDVNTVNPPGKVICQPGFVKITPGVVHKVNGTWALDMEYPLVDFSLLLEASMYTGIYEYSSNATGPWTELDGNFTFNQMPPGSKGNIYDGFFRFKDVFYTTSDGKVLSQIKYNQEGAPEDMAYLWPGKMFTWPYIQVKENGYVDPSTYTTPSMLFDITDLVKTSYYIDGLGRNLEHYDLVIRLKDYDVLMHPGFYTIPDPMNSSHLYYGGYDFIIKQVGANFYLGIYTVPGEDTKINKDDCWGICWPLAKKGTPGGSLNLEIFIRRRPAMYHNLFINQLMDQFPWKPHTDTGGNNLVTQDTIFFGKNTQGPNIADQDQGIWVTDIADTSYMKIHAKDPEIIKVTRDGVEVEVPLYVKEHLVVYGPHLTPDGILHTVNKVVESRISTNSQAQPDKNPINWVYDFDNQIVELHAEFAPKLVAPATSKNPTGEASGALSPKGFYDYNEGRTINNSSGIMVTKRSALKTLHEVPVGFFNYNNDLWNAPLRIGTIQNQWDSYAGNIDRYQSYDVLREIFDEDPKTGTYKPGTTYTYENKVDDNRHTAAEWTHILEEINLMFSPITRIGGVVVSGGDKQYYQNNVALLNYAAKETQDRLLKIERALFGVDAPELPKGLEGTQQFDWVQEKYESIISCLDDGGVVRVINELFYWNVFKNEAKELQVGITADLHKLKRAYSSSYYDIYLELFGEYETLNEFLAIPGNATGKFHDIYLWYKQVVSAQVDYIFNVFYKIPYQDSTPIFIPGKTTYPAIFSSKNIYLHKSHWGYSFENLPSPYFNIITQRYSPNTNAEPFSWPTSSQKNWSGAVPFDRWWYSNKIGLYDRKYIGPSKEEIKKYYLDRNYPDDENLAIKVSNEWRTNHLDVEENWDLVIASESVEGILYDIISLLSYLKENTDYEKQYFNAGFTTVNKIRSLKYMKTHFPDYENTHKFRLAASMPYLDNDREKQGLLKDQTEWSITFNSEVNLQDILISSKYNGEYATFGFEKDKFGVGYSNYITPKYLPNNITNLNKGYEKWNFISGKYTLENSLDYLVLNNLIKKERLPNHVANLQLYDNFIHYRYESSGEYNLNHSGYIDKQNQDINLHTHNNLRYVNAIGVSGGTFVSGTDEYRNEFKSASSGWIHSIMQHGEQIQRQNKISGIEVERYKTAIPWDSYYSGIVPEDVWKFDAHDRKEWNYISGWIYPILNLESSTKRNYKIALTSQIYGELDISDLIVIQKVYWKYAGHELFKGSTVVYEKRLTWIENDRTSSWPNWELIYHEGTDNELWIRSSIVIPQLYFNKDERTIHVPEHDFLFEDIKLLDIELPTFGVNDYNKFANHQNYLQEKQKEGVESFLDDINPQSKVYLKSETFRVDPDDPNSEVTVTYQCLLEVTGRHNIQAVNGAHPEIKLVIKNTSASIIFIPAHNYQLMGSTNYPFTISSDVYLAPGSDSSNNYHDVGIITGADPRREDYFDSATVSNTNRHSTLPAGLSLQVILVERGATPTPEIADVIDGFTVKVIGIESIKAEHTYEYELSVYDKSLAKPASPGIPAIPGTLLKTTDKLQNWKVDTSENDNTFGNIKYNDPGNYETKAWDVSTWPQQILPNMGSRIHSKTIRELPWTNYPTSIDYTDKINAESTNPSKPSSIIISGKYDYYYSEDLFSGNMMYWNKWPRIDGTETRWPNPVDLQRWKDEYVIFKVDYDSYDYNSSGLVYQLRYDYRKDYLNLKYGDQATLQRWSDQGDGRGLAFSNENLEMRKDDGNNDDYIYEEYFSNYGLTKISGNRDFDGNGAKVYGGFSGIISGKIRGQVYDTGNGEQLDTSTWTDIYINGPTNGWRPTITWKMNFEVSGYISGLVSGYLDATPATTKPVAWDNTIDRFYIRGGHIPADYDMLSRVRAQEHVSNQIQLALESKPYQYPKIPPTQAEKNNFIITCLEIEGAGDMDGIFIWKPSNKYPIIMITKANEEENVWERDIDDDGEKTLTPNPMNGKPQSNWKDKERYFPWTVAELYEKYEEPFPADINPIQEGWIKSWPQNSNDPKIYSDFIEGMLDYEDTCYDVIGFSRTNFYKPKKNSKSDKIPFSFSPPYFDYLPGTSIYDTSFPDFILSYGAHASPSNPELLEFTGGLSTINLVEDLEMESLLYINKDATGQGYA
jgi:hypothetical protein